MRRPIAQPFVVRQHTPDGQWLTNDLRYREYAHELLKEHESLCEQISALWPPESPEVLADSRAIKGLPELGRKREQSLDSVRIYASMAVEGYLNFYGVVRHGQHVFDEHIERLGLVPKLRTLLLICDELDVSVDHPVVLALNAVAKDRNSLVHPKTEEVEPEVPPRLRKGQPMPDSAQLAVKNMERFFAEFVALVPKARRHFTARTGA